MKRSQRPERRDPAAVFRAIIFIALAGFAAVFLPGQARGQEMVSLNFDQVDIATFLKTMSELTGRSFILNEKVQGTISFVSAREVSREEVYPIVLSILQASGFSAVREENNVVRIHPAQEALRMSGRIFYGREIPDPDATGVITQIIPLDFADVESIVNTVRPLFGNDLLLTAYPRNNTVIANAGVPTISLLLSMVDFLDTSIEQARTDLHIYKLENADAQTMAQTLSALAGAVPAQPRQQDQQQQRRPGELFSSRFSVVANKETNSLIIISAPQDYEKIKQVVQELDRKREQVLVEALIVEISLNDDQTLGFDLSAIADTSVEGMKVITRSDTGLMSEGLQTGGLPGLTVGLLNGTIPDAYAILNASKEVTDLKILSTPEIVTMDNHEAVINISEQIPFLTSSRVDENNNVIQTFDYKDIGIILRLTPQINQQGYITMQINQEVRKIVEGTRALENPSVFKREISSKVTVRDRRTIVIGGLIRDDVTRTEQKVPLLGDIPLLGLLFRKTVDQRTRTNLLVFITPYLITDDLDIEQITEQKRREQEEFDSKTKQRRR
ncbi:MAG: secretin N-terminal domain-containing protein [Spirochaetota bacterium]